MPSERNREALVRCRTQARASPSWGRRFSTRSCSSSRRSQDHHRLRLLDARLPHHGPAPSRWSRLPRRADRAESLTTSCCASLSVSPPARLLLRRGPSLSDHLYISFHSAHHKGLWLLLITMPFLDKLLLHIMSSKGVLGWDGVLIPGLVADEHHDEPSTALASRSSGVGTVADPCLGVRSPCSQSSCALEGSKPHADRADNRSSATGRSTVSSASRCRCRAHSSHCAHH